jgi:hypothetical protein
VNREQYFKSRMPGNPFELLAKSLHDSGGALWSKEDHEEASRDVAEEARRWMLRKDRLVKRTELAAARHRRDDRSFILGGAL